MTGMAVQISLQSMGSQSAIRVLKSRESLSDTKFTPKASSSTILTAGSYFVAPTLAGHETGTQLDLI